MRGDEIAPHAEPARVVVAEIELRRDVPAARGFLIPLGSLAEILAHAQAAGVKPGQAVQGIDIVGLGGGEPFASRRRKIATVIGSQAVAEISKRRAANADRGDEDCRKGKPP